MPSPVSSVLALFPKWLTSCLMYRSGRGVTTNAVAESRCGAVN